MAVLISCCSGEEVAGAALEEEPKRAILIICYSSEKADRLFIGRNVMSSLLLEE
jgi:hypothetical protein